MALSIPRVPVVRSVRHLLAALSAPPARLPRWPQSVRPAPLDRPVLPDPAALPVLPDPAALVSLEDPWTPELLAVLRVQELLADLLAQPAQRDPAVLRLP